MILKINHSVYIRSFVSMSIIDILINLLLFDVYISISWSLVFIISKQNNDVSVATP